MNVGDKVKLQNGTKTGEIVAISEVQTLAGTVVPVYVVRFVSVVDLKCSADEIHRA